MQRANIHVDDSTGPLPVPPRGGGGMAGMQGMPGMVGMLPGMWGVMPGMQGMPGMMAGMGGMIPGMGGRPMPGNVAAGYTWQAEVDFPGGNMGAPRGNMGAPPPPMVDPAIVTSGAPIPAPAVRGGFFF